MIEAAITRLNVLSVFAGGCRRPTSIRPAADAHGRSWPKADIPARPLFLSLSGTRADIEQALRKLDLSVHS